MARRPRSRRGVGGLAVACVFLYGLRRFAGEEIDGDIVVNAVGIALLLGVPPWLMLRPKRPTQDDVLRDQALRRAHGMDDTVAR